MSGPFSARLWAGSQDIYGAILAHPFIGGLTDGSLPHDAFAFFVIQDALYLQKYANALAAVASRAPDTAATETFARDAADIITVERDMHGALLADLGIDPGAISSAEPAPTTLAYTSYLMAATLGGSFAEGVAAVLPCYWIYWEVGQELVQRGSPDPRYQQWIGMYGSEDYGSVVRKVLDITDRLGPDLSAAERTRVNAHFRATSRYEWMFWDMGYRQETWPL